MACAMSGLLLWRDILDSDVFKFLSLARVRKALNEVRCFPDVVWNGLLGIQDHTERFRHWEIARARVIV